MRNQSWPRQTIASSRVATFRHVRNTEDEREFFMHRGLFLLATSLALWTGIFGIVKLITLVI